jgi:hypothetical protein
MSRDVRVTPDAHASVDAGDDDNEAAAGAMMTKTATITTVSCLRMFCDSIKRSVRFAESL